MYSRCFHWFPGPLTPSERFKAFYNVKNARVACNNPCGAYPTAEAIFQAVKGLGCSQRTFNGLSLDDFISSGSAGLQAAKGGSEVGLGSIDQGGSCWW